MFLNFLFIFFHGLKLFMVSDNVQIPPKELTASHIIPIIQSIEQSFAINEELFLKNVYLIKNDSLYIIYEDHQKYINKKIGIISIDQVRQIKCSDVNLFCRIIDIQINNAGDYDLRVSFEITGYSSSVMGFLNINFGKKGEDILPIYRLLHYSTFNSE